MDDNEKAYRASLQAVIDDENADAQAKARAKAILSAMDGEPDGDEPEKKDEESKAAEGDDDEKKHEEPDGDEAKALASASLEARVERMERAQLMASRPDLTEAQRRVLASVPVSALASALAAIPRATAKPAATATVPATRGEGQGHTNGAPSVIPDADLDRAFGLSKAQAPIRRDGLRTYFGVLTREQAASITAKHGGAQ